MSISLPIRLKIEQNGATKGYVETLNFSGGTVTVTGPIANIPVGGGAGGGDADTLQGHPASDFALTTDLALYAELTDLSAYALLSSLANYLLASTYNDRTVMFSRQGIAVQATPPVSGITYAQWLAGTAGYWAWIQIP